PILFIIDMESVLDSLCIIEQDTNGDILETWSYPIIDKRIEQLLISKCPLKNERYQQIPFFYSKFENLWYYCRTVLNTKIKNVVGFSIYVLAKVKKKQNELFK